MVHYFVAQELMAEYGISGLATSSMISSGLNLLLLLVGFRIFIGELMLWQLIKSLIKFTVAGAVMVFVIQGYDLLIAYFGEQFIVKLLSLFMTIGASIFVYFGMTSVLKSEEYNLVFANIQKKILGRLGIKKS